MFVAIAIGSNLGNRKRNFVSAYRSLTTLPMSEGFTFSPIYSTKSFGFDGAPDYLNAVVLFATMLSPEWLLEKILHIEKQHGRLRSQPNAPRTLDLDILFYGAEVVDTSELTIPHPRLHERLFVLVPLNDVAPDLIHPTLGVTIKTLRHDCEAAENEIKRYELGFDDLLTINP